MLSLVLVHLVDRDCGVNYARLDSLFLNNWLDVLVDVVMNMFSYNSTRRTLCLMYFANLTCILEL